MDPVQNPNLFKRFWWIFVVIIAATGALFWVMSDDGVNANQERNEQEKANR